MATNSSEFSSREQEETTEDGIEWVEESAEEEEAKVALGVVGKIWTERNVNSNALITTMRRVWSPKHGMEANCIGKNIFFFQFHHWKDKAFVMESQPWHFDRHALIINDIQGNAKPSDIPLYQIPFWVRVYDLPFKGRNNESNAKAIGDKVGVYMNIDKSDVVGINKSLRIRVMIDVRKPLVKEISLKRRGGIIDMIKISYEKLPLFCYLCGMLGHGEKDCNVENDDNMSKRKYGDQLRASPWKGNKGTENYTSVNNKESNDSNCARKLFVTKGSQTIRKDTEPKLVVDVTKQLQVVSLSPEISKETDPKALSKNPDDTPNALKKNTPIGVGACAITEETDVINDPQENSLKVSIKTAPGNEFKQRRFRKTERNERDLTTKGKCDGKVNQGNEKQSPEGKRKRIADGVDIDMVDIDENVKRAKLVLLDSQSSNKVAEDGLNPPREKQ